MTVKEWLNRYQTAWNEAKDIELRLTQIRLKYSRPSAIEYSDMPKAHKQTDLSDYIEQLEHYENMLIAKYQQCIGIEVQIYKAVDKVEDSAERMVLRYRYIDGMRWDDIANNIHCTTRTVYRLHGRALLHLRDILVKAQLLNCH